MVAIFKGQKREKNNFKKSLMKIFSEDIILLKEVQKDIPLEIYVLHLKYKLSPAQLARSIEKFSSLDIITIVSNEYIRITDFGKKWLIANKSKIYLFDRDSEWKKIPIEDAIESIGANKLYKVDLKKIDTRILKKIEGEK